MATDLDSFNSYLNNIWLGSSAPTISKAKRVTKVVTPATSIAASTIIATVDQTQAAAIAQTLSAALSPTVIYPAALVYCNSTPIGPPINFTTDDNAYLSSNSFTVDLALTAMPTGFDALYWSQGEQRSKKIKIDAAWLNQVNGAVLQQRTMITGFVDDISIDWRSQVITLHGRDRMAELLDTKTAETFNNQTSSQVALTIALRHGMNSSITDTTTLVGAYYNTNKALLCKYFTEFSLLKVLAAEEGFNFWVDGDTLHFEAAEDNTQQPYVFFYYPATDTHKLQANLIDLKTSRSETLAGDISVTVVSWDAKNKLSVRATAKRSRVTASKILKETASQSGDKQEYFFSIPGLTLITAQTQANTKLAELSSHERVIDVDIPADLLLTARMPISLYGTGTVFDQIYFVDRITWSMNVNDGFRANVHCKNHSPSLMEIGS